MNFTERVYATMQKKGIQQKDLCEYINYSKSRLSYTLSKNRDFSADDVLGISKCLGVSVNYLLTGEEDQPEEHHSDLFTEDETELLAIYRSIDHEGKTTIMYNAYQQRSRYRASNDHEKNITNQTA